MEDFENTIKMLNEIKELIHKIFLWLFDMIPKFYWGYHSFVSNILKNHSDKAVFVIDLAILAWIVKLSRDAWKKKYTTKKETQPEIDKLLKKETKTERKQKEIDKANQLKLYVVLILIFLVVWAFSSGGKT